MKDERINKEMNQIKGYVCLYMFIASLVLGIVKTLVLGFEMNFFLVELYVISITLMIFGLVIINRIKAFDERIEQNINRIFRFGFIVLFIGGLWVHFYQVIITIENQLFIGYITNTLILIGFIVTLILLKRKGLYANYRFIEHSKTRYYRHIAFNVSRILLVFVMMCLSFFALSLLNLELNILIFLISVLIVMISIEYILFSIYEKNHYDEMICFEQGNPNLLSKNVFLFQMFVFVFMTLSAYTNLRLSLGFLTNLSENREELISWTIANSYIMIMSIDFYILSLITIIIAYRYLVKLLGKSLILRVFLGFSIFGFLFSLVSYSISLLSPIIPYMFESTLQLEAFLQNYSTLSIIMSLISSTFYAIMGIILFIKGIAYKKLVLSYSIYLIITNPIFINAIFEGYTRNLFITNFIVYTIGGFIYLTGIGLFGYTKHKNSKFIYETINT